MASLSTQNHPIKIIFDFKNENGCDAVEIVKNPVRFLYGGSCYIKGYSTLGKNEKIFNTSKVTGDIYNQLTQTPVILSEIVEVAAPETFEGIESSCFIFHCLSCDKDLLQDIDPCPHCGESRTKVHEKASLVDNVKALGGQVKEYVGDHIQEAKNHIEDAAFRRRAEIAAQQERAEQQQTELEQEEAARQSRRVCQGGGEAVDGNLEKLRKIKVIIGSILLIIVCIGTIGSFFNIPMINKFTIFNRIDQEKFDNLYRSFKTIEGAINVGVNYGKYGELLQSVSTEIVIVKDKIKNGNERKLFDYFNDVFLAYNDCFLIWKSKISSGSKLSEKGRIVVTTEIEPMVSKYALDAEPYEVKIAGITIKEYQGMQSISSNDSMQVIWKKASDLLKKANEIYHP
jgi:hypothetical protein